MTCYTTIIVFSSNCLMNKIFQVDISYQISYIELNYLMLFVQEIFFTSNQSSQQLVVSSQQLGIELIIANLELHFFFSTIDDGFLLYVTQQYFLLSRRNDVFPQSCLSLLHRSVARVMTMEQNCSDDSLHSRYLSPISITNYNY